MTGPGDLPVGYWEAPRGLVAPASAPAHRRELPRGWRSTERPGERAFVAVIAAPDGRFLATAAFSITPGGLYPEMLFTRPEERRCGLATHLLASVEQDTGRRVLGSRHLSAMGAALWSAWEARSR